MLVVVDPNDARAVRNKETVIAMYDRLINNKKSMEMEGILGDVYIQHNPLLENDLGAAHSREKRLGVVRVDLARQAVGFLMVDPMQREPGV